MTRVLIIDDEAPLRGYLQRLLEEANFTVEQATDGASGLAQFQDKRPDVVLLDIQLPDYSGLELFRRLAALDPQVPVVLMTGHGTAETAIEAIRSGAFEYILKPFDRRQLVDLVERALEVSRLMRSAAHSPRAAQPARPPDALIGRSAAMQDVFKAVGRIAAQDVTVLILGESGTGKEMIARAIHQHGPRRAGPMVALNCAALPETLLESELFGHEKGSFTGADQRRLGRFERGAGGTLFLDEVGDMPQALQAKLLRVLQDKRFERVGGCETLIADTRVIAATNRALDRLTLEGRFRADLYYRLNVFTIRLPPLRERPEDIPLLAEHFVQRYSQELDRRVECIAPEALELLQAYSWPGNVRELQSVLKQALLQARGPVLGPAFLPDIVRQGAAARQGAAVAPRREPREWADLRRYIRDRLAENTTDLYEEVLTPVERALIEEVLRFTQGNQSQAARRLGITRPTLRSKLAALDLGSRPKLAALGPASESDVGQEPPGDH